jgi:hypothetical protein
MAVSPKLPIVNPLPPIAGKPAFLIVQDKLNQVYVVASGGLGTPISVDPGYAVNNTAIAALANLKAEANLGGNASVLNVEFAALIDQANAMIRIAGNARASVEARKRKRPRK